MGNFQIGDESRPRVVDWRHPAFDEIATLVVDHEGIDCDERVEEFVTNALVGDRPTEGLALSERTVRGIIDENTLEALRFANIALVHVERPFEFFNRVRQMVSGRTELHSESMPSVTAQRTRVIQLD